MTRSNLLESVIETSNLAKISMVLPTGIKSGQFSSIRGGNASSAEIVCQIRLKWSFGKSALDMRVKFLSGCNSKYNLTSH